MKMTDILKITPDDANKMSTQELYDAVWDLSRAVNKMRSGLIRAGMEPVSLQTLERKGGRLSVMQLDSQGKSTGVPKNRNELYKELMRGLQFYKAADSSVTKQKAIMKDIEKRYNTKFSSLKEYSDFWAAVRKIDEIASTTGSYMESDDEVSVALDMDNFDSVNISEITDKITKIYRSKLDEKENKMRELKRHRSKMFSGNN